MQEDCYTAQDVIRAESAAVEAALIAERLRQVGAWFAYAAAAELAETRRARADAMKARLGRFRTQTAAGAADQHAA